VWQAMFLQRIQDWWHMVCVDEYLMSFIEYVND